MILMHLDDGLQSSDRLCRCPPDDGRGFPGLVMTIGPDGRLEADSPCEAHFSLAGAVTRWGLSSEGSLRGRGKSFPPPAKKMVFPQSGLKMKDDQTSGAKAFPR